MRGLGTGTWLIIVGGTLDHVHRFADRWVVGQFPRWALRNQVALLTCRRHHRSILPECKSARVSGEPVNGLFDRAACVNLYELPALCPTLHGHQTEMPANFIPIHLALVLVEVAQELLHVRPLQHAPTGFPST